MEEEFVKSWGEERLRRFLQLCEGLLSVFLELKARQTAQSPHTLKTSPILPYISPISSAYGFHQSLQEHTVLRLMY